MTEALVDMPTFSFKNLSFKDDKELATYDKENGKGFTEKFFKPGSYEVTISKVDVNGKCPKDDTWVSLCIHLKGTDAREIRGYVQVPTDDIKYGEKKTLFPYKNLQVFCAALGHTLTVPTLKDTMKALFSKPENLVGQPIVIKVGYQKGYAKYAGKREDGSKYYVLFDKDNNVVRDQVGAELRFDDHAAAHLYADDNKIPVDRFVAVLAYSQSSATNRHVVDSTGW